MSDTEIPKEKQEALRLVQLFIGLIRGDLMILDKDNNELDWLQDCLDDDKKNTTEMLQSIVDVMTRLIYRNLPGAKIVSSSDIAKELFKKD